MKVAIASRDVNHKTDTKRKAVPRHAAGQTWEDPSLAEWPKNNHRLFCGDLGNVVNDDVLSWFAYLLCFFSETDILFPRKKKLLLEQNELHVARILVYEGCEREVVEAGKQSDEFLQYWCCLLCYLHPLFDVFAKVNPLQKVLAIVHGNLKLFERVLITWELVDFRIEPLHCPLVKHDFGFISLISAAHKAGKQTQDGRDEEITVLRVKIQNLKDDAAAAVTFEQQQEASIFFILNYVIHTTLAPALGRQLNPIKGIKKADKGKEVEDSSSPYGIHLVIEDYPYAVDGLEIWFAIKEWVQDCVSLYYPTDNDLKRDPELQNWWKEAVEVGHGDLKDKPWWPKMQTVEELVESCTTIIWTASALHAAVNFGQYPCGGLILNRPTLSIRLLPEQGTAEYEEMVKSHQKAYLITITPKLETLIDFTTIEILSKHASDEVYLRERDNPHWTFGSRALQPF
ncbi:hypothetical protein AHAS_Ahas09G0168300 [Arachis hypogaea]